MTISTGCPASPQVGQHEFAEAVNQRHDVLDDVPGLLVQLLRGLGEVGNHLVKPSDRVLRLVKDTNGLGYRQYRHLLRLPDGVGPLVCMPEEEL